MEKNNKKYLLLLAAAGAGYWLWSQAKSISALNYVISGVQLGWSGITPLINLTLAVQNVSNQSYILNSFVGTVSVNGNNIGNVSNFTPTAIPATSQTPYTLNIALSLVGAVSDLINLITNKTGAQQDIVLSGYVNASGIVTAVTLNYTVI